MVKVIDVEHHLLNTLANELVHLGHSLAWRLLIAVIVGLQRYGLAELNKHIGTRVEIVGVVVARGQYHHIALKLHLLGSTKCDAQISNLEGAEPTLILVSRLGIHHKGLAIGKCLTRSIHSLVILIYGSKAVITHTVCREQTQSTQCLIKNRILEYISACNEVHTSVGECKADTKGVIQAVLMVRHHNHRGTIGRHIFHTYNMLLSEIKAGVYILQIQSESLQKQ